MNVRDSEVISGLLRKEGFGLTDDCLSADIIIFNTCAVRQHAEDKVWSEIGKIAKLRKKRRGAGTVEAEKNLRGSPQKAGTVPIVGLIGCMAQNYKEMIFQKAPAVDFVVGPSDIAKIPEIIYRFLGKEGQSPKNGILNNSRQEQSPESGDSPCLIFERKIWETEGNLRPDELYHSGFHEDKNHAFVVISEGCSNFCSYCVVPYVRGALHHRHHNGIIKEIKDALAEGITGITLLGQNVNAYSDDKVDFIQLLQKINALPGLKEFSFITSHPKDTPETLFKTMADLEKIKKCLHLPVQSGSNKILSLMNRGYTREDYIKIVEQYRTIVQKGKISTDIIVGFPTETDDDFQDTYRLMQEIAFDSAYIFKYSPRPNTAASKMADTVEKKEKEGRHGLLLNLQKGISNNKKG